MTDELPKKNNLNYENLMKNFMWFQPQSATGNTFKMLFQKKHWQKYTFFFKFFFIFC